MSLSIVELGRQTLPILMSPGEDSEEDTSLFNYVFMMKILVNFATNIVIIYVHGL